MDPQPIFTFLGIVGPLSTAALAWIHWGGERRKSGLDETRSFQEIGKNYREEIEDLEESLRDGEQSFATLQDRARTLEAENARLRTVAPALAKALLLRAGTDADVSWLLNFAGQPGAHLWAITAPNSNGRRETVNASMVWVSEGWRTELGLAPKDLLGTAWWDRLHPGDRARTAAAEAGASSGRVRVGNRYRAADGTYVTLDWRALAYDEECGLALAVALVVGKADA